MAKLDCGVCLFADLCQSSQTCPYFTLFGPAEDLLLLATIERVRSDYYQEWWEYVGENGDDLYY